MESNKLKRGYLSKSAIAVASTAASCGINTHVFLDVNVSHAFAVEFLLHAGDGSIVARDPVDSSVLQSSLLQHFTAHFHN